MYSAVVNLPNCIWLAVIAGPTDQLRSHHAILDTKTYEQRVRSVTPAEVWRVARDYLRPERFTIVAVGDPDAVRAGLDRFGPVVEG